MKIKPTRPFLQTEN